MCLWPRLEDSRREQVLPAAGGGCWGSGRESGWTPQHLLQGPEGLSTCPETARVQVRPSRQHNWLGPPPQDSPVSSGPCLFQGADAETAEGPRTPFLTHHEQGLTTPGPALLAPPPHSQGGHRPRDSPLLSKNTTFVLDEDVTTHRGKPELLSSGRGISPNPHPHPERTSRDLRPTPISLPNQGSGGVGGADGAARCLLASLSVTSVHADRGTPASQVQMSTAMTCPGA